MLLSDEKIRALIEGGVLERANEHNVGPVSYDLTTDYFSAGDGRLSNVRLMPGDSVFVAAKEVVSLPDDLAARVLLRNSRIRQGLSLDAPLYFPGHRTVVFFRITNVCADEIDLDCAKGIAQIVFERVEGSVERSYEGEFSEELDFRGMGSYSDVYDEEIKKLERKADEIKGIEQRMYERVLALMAIFAAIFTLVNVNAGTLSQGGGTIVVVNLVVIGGFSVLVGLIAWLLRPGEKRWLYTPLAVGIVCFIAALACSAAGLG